MILRIDEMIRDSRDIVDFDPGSEDLKLPVKVPAMMYRGKERSIRADSLRLTSKICTISSTRDRSNQPSGVSGAYTI